MNANFSIDQFLPVYRDTLLNDVIPFWMRNGLDREHGGYFTCLDRTGRIMDTDKPVWFQGRFAWMLSTLYSEVEPRQEWLDGAKLGIDFIRKHCFDTDGRMFFRVTQDGRPVHKRRYAFSETFAVVALAAYARASGETRAAEEAKSLFKTVLHLFYTPGAMTPKINPAVRPSKGLGRPMILLVTAQVMRTICDEPWVNDVIDECIREIRTDFMKPQLKAVLEMTAPDGSLIDHMEGRMLCPGHAIEAAWFIMAEAKHRNNDRELVDVGRTILDWTWDWGWDTEFGGILYYRDVKGFPQQEYWQDMKFWWPHNETIIATLMAYQMTGDERYARMHQQAHDWSFKHFSDREHGEWYGYLRRDGAVANTAKGNLWKGPFHLPRMLLVCWQVLEEMKLSASPTA